MINIVIIHTGFDKYVVHTLKQLRKTNPNSNIFLITDDNYKEYNKYSTFVDIKSLLKKDSIHFANIYVHFGKSNPKFEMFCMQRWIILRDFMIEYSIDSCIHIDSDVLVFSDLSGALIPFNNYSISLSNNLALSMYIRDISILDEFVNFLLLKYGDKNQLQSLSDMFYNTDRCRNGVAGSISDMDLSREFFSSRNNVGNLSSIINNSTFDSSIVYGDPLFEMIEKNRYKMKKIFFENEVPYCNAFINDRIEKVRFHSLHLLTWTKVYINKLSKHKNLDFNPYFISLYREFNVLKSKLKK